MSHERIAGSPAFNPGVPWRKFWEPGVPQVQCGASPSLQKAGMISYTREYVNLLQPNPAGSSFPAICYQRSWSKKSLAI